VSQILLAGPLLAMYEGSIWIAKIFQKRKGREEDGTPADEKEKPSPPEHSQT
jgi:Sec-independent protein secretion pathway component TatC